MPQLTRRVVCDIRRKRGGPNGTGLADLPRMTRHLMTAMFILAAIRPAAAQDTRAAEIAARQGAKARVATPEIEPAGQRVLKRLQGLFAPKPPAIAPTFGGLRAGSGFAPGVELLAPAGRSLVVVRGAWSVQNARLGSALVEVPRTPDGSALSLLARWEDTPHTEWFGPGMTAALRREYALQTTEFVASARRRVVGPVRAFADAGLMHANTSEFGRSTWLQSAFGAAVDTRTSPGYTRRGGLYAASVEHLAARTSNQSSFDRMVIDLRHFIPLMDENWVIAMQGRAELTANAGSAPAFLLPYVGGGSTLRGYHEYRFTGQQAVLLRGELRWMAGPAVDFAAFVDHGVVADRVRALAADDMRRGWGIGARWHGDTFTALRVDVAHGSEGWHLHVAQTASF